MKIKDLILYGLCIISMATATVSVVRSHVIQGEQGIQGEVGLKGDKGDKGEDGLNGLDGLDGKDGKDGRDGIDGINGLDGKDGRDGVDGKDGADGAKGDKGDTGATGAQGEKGDKGDTGEKGQDGQTPYIGENGNWWIGDSDTGVLAEGQIYVTSSYYAWVKKTINIDLLSCYDYGSGNPDGGISFPAFLMKYGEILDYSNCKLSSYLRGNCSFSNNVRNITNIKEYYLVQYYNNDRVFTYDGTYYIYEYSSLINTTKFNNYSIELPGSTQNRSTKGFIKKIEVTAEFWTLIK